MPLLPSLAQVLPGKLTFLSLGPNRLSGPLPTNLALPAGLTSFLISNNSYTGTIPATWRLPAGLLDLSVAANRLTGTLPSNWSLPQLQVLGLNDNAFTGKHSLRLDMILHAAM